MIKSVNLSQQCDAGVAVGGGWQGLVAYINLGCYYIFGLPLGFILGYVLHLGPQVTFVSVEKPILLELYLISIRVQI